MAEKENGEDPQVNLEMPSFRRKKKARQEEVKAVPEPEAEGSPEAVTEWIEPETRPLYVDDVPPVPATESPLPEAMPAEAMPAEPSEPEPAKPPKPPRASRPPIVAGMVAAILTGAVVGGLAVGLTYLGLLGCDQLQGTESCGGPGFFILVAIMVLMVASGSWLLKFFQVADPGSTSFLAVGLAIVIALLFLIDVIFEWYMFIVMPLVFVSTYALAHWVTVRYIEPADHG